jgi:4-diphosphocytidyl-2-C-methyl-D-erythritol kinase
VIRAPAGAGARARREPLPLPLRALAPAKINLGLFIGTTPPTRADGKHELVSVMQSISLADELTLHAAAAGERDEVVCEGVEGENLAARALALFRHATGWEGERVRLQIVKRVPVAAGMGGGSADAAATLRLASAASGLGEEPLLLELAAQLGADVPAQVSPGRWLAAGAGEILEKLPDPSVPLGVLVLASPAKLSTAEVYGMADRLRLGHDASYLEGRRRALRQALGQGATLPREAGLLHNDLQGAAVALCETIPPALEAARGAGAEVAIVSGSGPTVVGLFGHAGGAELARLAMAKLTERSPSAVAAVSVGAGFASVQPART